jgi:hypothetical protein
VTFRGRADGSLNGRSVGDVERQRFRTPAGPRNLVGRAPRVLGTSGRNHSRPLPSQAHRDGPADAP